MHFKTQMVVNNLSITEYALAWKALSPAQQLKIFTSVPGWELSFNHNKNLPVETVYIYETENRILTGSMGEPIAFFTLKEEIEGYFSNKNLFPPAICEALGLEYGE